MKILKLDGENAYYHVGANADVIAFNAKKSTCLLV